jgi:hypothetical protein
MCRSLDSIAARLPRGLRSLPRSAPALVVEQLATALDLFG